MFDEIFSKDYRGTSYICLPACTGCRDGNRPMECAISAAVAFYSRGRLRPILPLPGKNSHGGENTRGMALNFNSRTAARVLINNFLPSICSSHFRHRPLNIPRCYAPMIGRAPAKRITDVTSWLFYFLSAAPARKIRR